jgi:hypothetical protein
VLRSGARRARHLPVSLLFLLSLTIARGRVGAIFFGDKPYRALAILRCGSERSSNWSLHGANRTRHVAVTGISDALQGGGKVEQECVTACHSQRASRIEDSGELEVGERNRPHVAPEGGYSPTYAIWRTWAKLWLGIANPAQALQLLRNSHLGFAPGLCARAACCGATCARRSNQKWRHGVRS